jgi:putative nucleotidyltransferase with HDIG domain
MLFESITKEDWYRYVKSMPMLQSAVEVLNKLDAVGKAYIVGGAVRDLITGEKEPDDIDIATDVPIEQIEKMFETFSVGQGKEFGIIGVEHNQYTFEVAQFRTDGEYLDGRRPETVKVGVSFKEDAARRDFTINAMGIDSDGNIFDYFDGVKDIQNKTLRTVGDPNNRFLEDYLRMLRAVRFSSRMDYDIHPDTYSALKTHSSKIAKIAPERIMKEIIKMAEQTGPKFASALQVLKDTGLLQYIIPEVTEMEKYEHNPDKHPEGRTVYDHIIAALHQNKIANPIINLAILLHDIGKPASFKKEGEKLSYIDHAEKGVHIIEQIAERLKMDNETRESLIFACLHHMKLHDFVNMSDKKILDLINHDKWEVLKQTAYADSAARKHLFDPAEWKQVEDKVEQIKQKFSGKQALDNIKKIVNGRLVMQLKGIPEGPAVGRYIKATVDWIINNNINVEDIEKIKGYIQSLP